MVAATDTGNDKYGAFGDDCDDCLVGGTSHLGGAMATVRVNAGSGWWLLE